MENLNEPENRSCAICARVLHAIQLHGETHWVHADEENVDHPAIPVEPDEIETEYRCDFCFKANPPWVLPTKPFEADPQVFPGVGLVDSMSGSNFATCDECARLIREGRWNSVVRRVIRSVEERHGLKFTGEMGVEIRVQLHEFYNRVRQNVTGDLYPLEKPQS